MVREDHQCQQGERPVDGGEAGRGQEDSQPDLSLRPPVWKECRGHVGETGEGYEGVHSGHGYGTRNEEGVRIIEFGDATGLVLTNTFFRKAQDKLVTYSSGKNKSALDFIMVTKEDRVSIRNVKVIHSKDTVQQHILVIADMNFKDRRQSKAKYKP